MSVFIHKRNFCIIQQNSDEIPEHFMYRGFLIVRQKTKSYNDFKEFERLSNYVINIKFLHCSYSDNINEKCKMLMNVFNDQN